MAELVDAHGSGPCAFGCGGSSPLLGTSKTRPLLSFNSSEILEKRTGILLANSKPAGSKITQQSWVFLRLPPPLCPIPHARQPVGAQNPFFTSITPTLSP